MFKILELSFNRHNQVQLNLMRLAFRINKALPLSYYSSYTHKTYAPLGTDTKHSKRDLLNPKH